EIVYGCVIDDIDIPCIYVKLNVYTASADRGSKISMFDDIDIDYNQNKYLIETRMSGALTKPMSAIVVKKVPGELVSPVSPSFDSASHTITIPPTPGVESTIDV